MRAHAIAGVMVGAAVASIAVLAFAQAPWGYPDPSPVDASASVDGGPPVALAIAPDAASALDAAMPSDAGTSIDAATPPDAAIAAVAPPPPPPANGEALADAGYEPSNVGLSVGIRGGYSVPFGAAKDIALSSLVGGVVPIGVDVGWFFNPHLYVGGYFLYGFAMGVENGNPSACAATADGTCSATVFRFGAVVHYHLYPEAGRRLDPWFGGGLGYDIVNLEASDQTTGSTTSGSLHGFLVSLETGVDYKPLPYVGMGPYVDLTSGHYVSSTSATSLHEWLTFGLRLRTNL